MTNQELYDGIANEGLSLPSTMGIFPSSKDFVFSRESIENSLKSTDYFQLINFDLIEIDKDENGAVKQEYQLVVSYLEEEFDVKKRQEVYDLYWYFACERQKIFLKIGM